MNNTTKLSIGKGEMISDEACKHTVDSVVDIIDIGLCHWLYGIDQQVWSRRYRNAGQHKLRYFEQHADR